MKKITALIFGAILLFSFAGCAQSRFMNDNEIKDIQNPTGTMVFSIKQDGTYSDVSVNFQLFYKQAPITVTNFTKLVNDGFYDGMYVTDFFVDDDKDGFFNVLGAYYKEQDDTAFSYKELDYSIKGEFSKNGWDKNTTEHGAWTLSMILDSENLDSASYKFTVLIDGDQQRDGNFAAFGAFVNVPSSLLSGLLNADSSKDAVKIKSVTVDTHGTDLGAPITIKK